MTLEWRYISRECKHTKTHRLLLAEDAVWEEVVL